MDLALARYDYYKRAYPNSVLSTTINTPRTERNQNVAKYLHWFGSKQKPISGMGE